MNDAPLELSDEAREHQRQCLDEQLTELVAHAQLLGLVITVEHYHPTPLSKPRMRSEIRCARGYYPKG